MYNNSCNENIYARVMLCRIDKFEKYLKVPRNVRKLALKKNIFSDTTPRGFEYFLSLAEFLQRTRYYCMACRC